MVRAWAACLLLLLPPQDDVRSLVEKLRSDSAPERGEAERKLRALGSAAQAELEKAAKDPDAEVAGRAQRLLRLIPLRDVVTPRLRAALPGVEERLASDDPRAWTEAFHEAASRPTLRSNDLDPLAARALRAAADAEETRAILETAAKRGLRSAVPEAAARLKDADGSVRKKAIETLYELRAKEQLPALAACLKDPNHGVREEAVLRIWYLGRDDALPLLLPAFKDPSPDVKLQVATWLSDAPGAVVDEGFTGFLDDKQSPGVIGRAVEVLGARGVREAAPRIRTLLDHPVGSVRASALRAWGRMADRGELGGVVRYIVEDDFVTRRAAFDVLRARRYREGIPEIRKLLKHESADVRRAGVVALRELGAWEAAADLAALLRDPDPDVRDEVPSALARIRARGAVSALVESLADPKVRLQAVKALGELGSVGAVPGLVSCLEGADGGVREAVVRSLAALQAEEAGAGFLAMLRRDTPAGFAERAGELQLRSLVPELVKFAASEDPARQRLGLSALHELEAPESVPAILRVAREGVLENRIWAVWRLDGRRGREEADFLLGALKDGPPELQNYAARTTSRLPGALPLFIKLLGSPGEGVRFQSLWALKELRAREALPAVIARVEDEADSVRECAVSALRALAATETLPLLTGLLQEDPSGVRGEAVCALAEMGAPGAEAAALALLEDPSWQVRTDAARALATLRTPGAKAGILRLFRDEVDEVRLWALWTFAGLAGKEDVPAIAARLADLNDENRGEACRVLARLGMRDAGPMLARRLGDRSDRVRQRAVEALLDLGVKEALPSIVPLLEDPSAPARERAAWAVALLEGPDRVVSLLADEDEGVRWAAVAAIGARGSSKVAPLLKHEWGEARAAACRALGAMGKGAEDVLPLVRDADFGARAAAAAALGLLRSGEAELVGLLDDREPRVRAAAVNALGSMGSKRAELRKRLEDVRSEVRAAAVRALGEEAAIQLLADPHRDVRRAAVEVLGRLGRKEAILPHLKDPSDRVRAAAGAWLCRRGDRAGFVEALRGQEFFALNAIRDPAAWSALSKARLPEAVEGTPREIAERIAREAGLSLDWTPVPFSHRAAWRPPFVRVAAGTSALDALPAILGEAQAMLLEAGRLRVVSRLDAYKAEWLAPAK
jgi:HEAT repeat protein